MVTVLAQALVGAHLVAESDSSSSSNFAFLFLLAGFIFWGYVFLRYRNVDKRHHHESETAAATQSMKADDTFARSLKGLSNSTMQGANHKKVSGALNRFFS